MQRVTVKHRKVAKKLPTDSLLKPITDLWPLLSLILPVLVFKGLVTFGIPALWIAESRVSCQYLDPIGQITLERHYGDECNWYAFRPIQVLPININAGGQ